MIRTCVRAAAAAWVVCGGILPASPWQQAQAAPVVRQKAPAEVPEPPTGALFLWPLLGLLLRARRVRARA